ncbi:MAG: hypothetical protein Q9227_006402 [Pyrenula ochraceoflavens]
MAEYWKSTPKYWCKQCSTYVKDTKFERTQHEATAKHQGNLKRALRELHRNNERQEREKQRAKAEVDRLNRIASDAPAPVGRSDAQPLRKVTPAAANPQATAAERKRQLTQLADMGISIPDEFRADMAMAGDWKTVSVAPVSNEEENKESVKPLSIGVRKRKNDDDVEDGGENGAQPERVWGSTTRTYPDKDSKIDADIDTLLAGHAKSRERLAKPAIKKEDVDGDVGVSMKRAAASERVPAPSTKDEEFTDLKGSPNNDPSEGIVFKKRKSRRVPA